MKGRDLTMKKMDQVDRTVLCTVGSCILKCIAFDFNNTALQRSTTKMSHVIFLLEYKIKIVFPSLGWEIILQIIPCAARLVPDSEWLSFFEKKIIRLPSFFSS